MITVIDMPPPEESVWWRGKRGFEVECFPYECVDVELGTDLSVNTSSASNDPTEIVKKDGFHDDGVDSDTQSEPTKPVLRKHGKLISFFRSFILSRPSRGKLKKSGILKERVFGCDLSEHLFNTSQEVPSVLVHCAEFIETEGIVDGIYRLSGIASNIQKLRVAFDEDRVPNLYQEKGVLQDVHSVSSLLKMYFRELPNPLCTYFLYDRFVEAAQSPENERLILMRDVVQRLPAPNYRTLEYLSRHLYRVSLQGNKTGMTAKNVAIVWAPNLLRSKSLEEGGVAALQGVGVQAVVTECLIRYCEMIFSDADKYVPQGNGRASASPPPSVPQVAVSAPDQKKTRPKSLAISTPTKLLTLEEARNRALAKAAANLGEGAPVNTSSVSNTTMETQTYIHVGGGPENLPVKYHTVIDISNRQPGGSMKHRKSPLGWKAIFVGAKPKPRQIPKISSPALIDITTIKDNSKLMFNPDINDTINQLTLRPVKSAESLTALQKQESDVHFEVRLKPLSGELDDIAPLEAVTEAVGRKQDTSMKGHERSSSHDSYFKHKFTPRHSTEDAESSGEAPTKQKSPKVSHDQEGSMESSPKTHSKMSFRKKLKCFTSPTILRRDSDESVSSTAASSLQSNEATKWSSSIRERLVSALSPESLRRRAGFQESPQQLDSKADEVQPIKKISEPTQSPKPTGLAKNISDDTSETQAKIIKTSQSNASATARFYDVSFEGPKTPEVISLEDTAIQVQNARFSSTSSTDDEYLATQDQLVVAQVHFHSCTEEPKPDSDDELGYKEYKKVSKPNNQEAQVRPQNTIAFFNEPNQQDKPPTAKLFNIDFESKPDDPLIGTQELQEVCNEKISTIIDETHKEQNPEVSQKVDQVQDTFNDSGSSVAAQKPCQIICQPVNPLRSQLSTPKEVAQLTTTDIKTKDMKKKEDTTRVPKSPIQNQLDCIKSPAGEKKSPPTVLPNPMSLKVFPQEGKDPPQAPIVEKTPEKVGKQQLESKGHRTTDSNQTSQVKKISVPKSKEEVAQGVTKVDSGVIDQSQKPIVTLKSSDSSLPPTGQVGGLRGLKVDQARSDLTFRTYGPKPYTKKETFQTPVAPIDKESFSCISAKETVANPVKEVHKDPEVRFQENVQSSDNMSYSPKKDVNKLQSPKNSESSAIKPLTASPDHKKVKTGILSGVSFISKIPADQTLGKTKKHSTFSLQSSEDMSGTEQAPSHDDGLLQRRNSIHNVPYVDVNDPATRERMERYKEERRSMLRSKFRVEDYREKAPAGKLSSGSSASQARPTELSTSPTRPLTTVQDPKQDGTTSLGIRKTSKQDHPADNLVQLSNEAKPSRNEKQASPSLGSGREGSTVSKSQTPRSLVQTPSLRKMPVEKVPLSSKSTTNLLADTFNQQHDTPDGLARKWLPGSRSSLASSENRRVSVSIFEHDAPVKAKVSSVGHKGVKVTPVTSVLPSSTPVTTSTVLPLTPFSEVSITKPDPIPIQQPKLRARTSCSVGLIEDEVNVRDRAAIFNTAAAHRANQAELRTKFVSLAPSNEDSRGSSKKILGMPGSPNKIKNIAAMFEQKT